MKKVLHVCETVTGGVSTYLNVLETLVGTDFENQYLIPSVQRDNVWLPEEKVLEHGGSRKSLIALLKFWWGAFLAVKKYKPDIVFVHSTFAGLVGALLKPFIKSKVIFCPHGYASLREQGKIKRVVIELVEKVICSLVDLVINISVFEHEYSLGRKFPGKKVLIENSMYDWPSLKYLSVPERHGSDVEEKINLLFVGRFDRQKGLDLLISTLKDLPTVKEKFHLTVIGDSFLDKGNISLYDFPWLTFKGWLKQEEIREHYLTSDMLVVPSRWEGFGLVVLEAYMHSLPVLVSNRGGLPHLVKVDRTGYVFEFGKEELKEALIRLEKGEINSMKPFCRQEFLSNYSGERFRKEYISAINQVS